MKVNARIVFADFRKVQGWRWYAIRWLTGSNHTHAHLEFDFRHPFAIVCSAGKKTQVIRLSYLRKLGIENYYEFDIGDVDLTDDDILYAYHYPILSTTKMILYQLFGRFLNYEQPTSCITFICDYLRFKGRDVPYLFTPKELWENLHASDNVGWQGPCR